jgi:hypothetical protein
MNAPNDTTTPSQTGLRRMISPWGFRHLRGVADLRFAIGLFLTGLGVVLIVRGDYRWAALPLAGAMAHFALGYWQLTIARSAPARASASGR